MRGSITLPSYCSAENFKFIPAFSFLFLPNMDESFDIKLLKKSTSEFWVLIHESFPYEKWVNFTNFDLGKWRGCEPDVCIVLSFDHNVFEE